MNAMESVECSACGVSVVFSGPLQPPEMRRILPRVLAGANWIVVGESKLCGQCQAPLRDRLTHLTSPYAQTVKAAMADALWLRRIDVVK